MTTQSDFRKLQDDVINKLAPDSPNGTGWRSCYCPICKSTERKAAGVLVDDSSIAFNCFKAKCDANTAYTFDEPISRKFKEFCKSLDIKIPVSLSFKKSRIQKELAEALDDDLYKKHVYKDMSIPAGWEELTHTVNPKWSAYFESRKIPLSNVLYIRSGVYKGLTAIVLRFYDKVIGFQICDPDGHVKYRTLTDNEHIIAINPPLSSPCIVVEGVLDAYSIPNGVGLLGSRISPEQAYQLRGKDVIMIPDRSGNNFIEQAKKYGWKVCIPPWKDNDVNKAVQRLGIMVVCQMIHDNTFDNMTKAKIAYEQWRERKDDKQQKQKY